MVGAAPPGFPSLLTEGLCSPGSADARVLALHPPPERAPCPPLCRPPPALGKRLCPAQSGGSSGQRPHALSSCQLLRLFLVLVGGSSLHPGSGSPSRALPPPPLCLSPQAGLHDLVGPRHLQSVMTSGPGPPTPVISPAAVSKGPTECVFVLARRGHLWHWTFSVPPSFLHASFAFRVFPALLSFGHPWVVRSSA